MTERIVVKKKERAVLGRVKCGQRELREERKSTGR